MKFTAIDTPTVEHGGQRYAAIPDGQTHITAQFQGATHSIAVDDLVVVEALMGTTRRFRAKDIATETGAPAKSVVAILQKLAWPRVRGNGVRKAGRYLPITAAQTVTERDITTGGDELAGRLFTLEEKMEDIIRRRDLRVWPFNTIREVEANGTYFVLAGDLNAGVIARSDGFHLVHDGQLHQKLRDDEVFARIGVVKVLESMRPDWFQAESTVGAVPVFTVQGATDEIQ